MIYANSPIISLCEYKVMLKS